MKQEDRVEVCSNCKHFQRYYVIGGDRSFHATALGHCVNINLAKSLANIHVQKNDGCDLWQPYELQKLSIQYCAELRLQRISKDVADVLAVLRDVK